MKQSFVVKLTLDDCRKKISILENDKELPQRFRDNFLEKLRAAESVLQKKQNDITCEIIISFENERNN